MWLPGADMGNRSPKQELDLQQQLCTHECASDEAVSEISDTELDVARCFKLREPISPANAAANNTANVCKVKGAASTLWLFVCRCGVVLQFIWRGTQFCCSAVHVGLCTIASYACTCCSVKFLWGITVIVSCEDIVVLKFSKRVFCCSWERNCWDIVASRDPWHEHFETCCRRSFTKNWGCW